VERTRIQSTQGLESSELFSEEDGLSPSPRRPPNFLKASKAYFKFNRCWKFHKTGDCCFNGKR